MKKKTVEVKEQSINTFFNRYISEDKYNESLNSPTRKNFFADCLYLEKVYFEVDTEIIFEINDQTNKTNKQGVSVIKYKIEPYDDILSKMIKISEDFKLTE